MIAEGAKNLVLSCNDGWLADHLLAPSPISPDHHHQIFLAAISALSKEDSVRNVKDWPPVSALEREWENLVHGQQTHSLVFGLNSPKHSFTFCIQPEWFDVPLPSHWTAYTKVEEEGETGKGKGELASKKAVPLQLPFVFAVEHQVRYDGSVEDLAGLLNEEDLLVFLYGFFNDQHRMMRAQGSFHVDCHPGNILFRRTSGGLLEFAFSDFGKSASSVHADTTAHLPKNFRGSIDKVLDFVLREAKEKPQVQAVVKQIIAAEKSLRSQDITVNEYLEGLFKATREGLSSQYDHEQLNHLWDRLGCRFAVESLRSRLEVVEQELDATRRELNDTKRELNDTKRELNDTKRELNDTKRELNDTRRELNEMASKVELLTRQLAEQNKEITKLVAQIHELKEERRGKDKAGEETVRQSQQPHAEEGSCQPGGLCGTQGRN
ncbi:hypothetical protein QOT17_007416 [Balamuthia mandrillaris]